MTGIKLTGIVNTDTPSKCQMHRAGRESIPTQNSVPSPNNAERLLEQLVLHYCRKPTWSLSVWVAHKAIKA